MKLIIPINGENLDGQVNPSFGRTKQFMLVDSDSREFEIIPNEQNMTAAQGAGIQAAQTVIKSGAEAVITTHLGPKASRVLSEGGIKVFTAKAMPIMEALDLFSKNELEEMNGANVEGHWV